MSGECQKCWEHCLDCKCEVLGYKVKKDLNKFRKLLKEMPPGKIEIIPNDPKNKNVSKQMSAFVNWKVVQSRSDKHPEYGHPLGKILCRNLEEAQEYVNKSEFLDCFIRDYGDFCNICKNELVACVCMQVDE